MKEKYILPEFLSKEKIDEIMKAAYLANAHEKSVKSRDIAKYCDISPDSIGRNMKFLISVGFFVSSKKGFYKLTKLGLDYSSNLAHGFTDEAIKMLKQGLETCPIVIDLKKYLMSKGGKVRRDELESKAKVLANVHPDDTRFITGAKTLVDMMISSKILAEDKERGIVKLLEPAKEKRKPEITKTREMEQIEKKPFNINLTVVVNIVDETSLEVLKKTMKLLGLKSVEPEEE